MSLEQLNQLMEAGGWDALDLDKFEKMNQAERQAALLVCGHYLSVFTGSEQGRFVLRDLVTTFMLPPVAQPGDDDIAIGIKQGQQNVCRRIFSFIDTAKRGGAPQ